jgi:hypothetical protein
LYHPESKSLGPTGKRCGMLTHGLLDRTSIIAIASAKKWTAAGRKATFWKQHTIGLSDMSEHPAAPVNA